MSFVSKKICNQIKVLKSNWNNSNDSSSIKPINVLFMPFLGSQERYHKPYIQLYEKYYRPKNRPVIILVAQGGFKEMSRDTNGKKFSYKIVDAMDKNLHPSSKVIVHAMSIGNFVHSNLLYYNTKDDYQNRIACQIYDSPSYGGKMNTGGFEKIIDAYVETALIKAKMRSPILEIVLKETAIKYFQSRMDYWDNVVSNWESKSTNAPILNFYSSNDSFCDTIIYEELMNQWKLNGADVTAINFETSPHVKHLLQYPEVYEQNLTDFLLKLKI